MIAHVQRFTAALDLLVGDGGESFVDEDEAAQSEALDWELESPLFPSVACRLMNHHFAKVMFYSMRCP